MPPIVESIVLACLAGAPGFETLGQTIEKQNFEITGQCKSDVRWTHPSGYEVFISDLPDKRVCSVWYDGEYNQEAQQLDNLLTQRAERVEAPKEDDLGLYWALGDGQVLRLVVKQGESRRIGVALFVPANQG